MKHVRSRWPAQRNLDARYITRTPSVPNIARPDVPTMVMAMLPTTRDIMDKTTAPTLNNLVSVTIVRSMQKTG